MNACGLCALEQTGGCLLLSARRSIWSQRRRICLTQKALNRAAGVKSRVAPSISLSPLVSLCVFVRETTQMVRLSGGLLALFVSLSLSRFEDLNPRSDSRETRCSVRMRVMSLHVFLTSEINSSIK